ncbi:2-hydroxyacyl-CoA dehydratase subunit D [Frisingicoccus sp.]|uniref:2-hydroxyacyl-CoA dehydratase subunit D n=1 Tax=Frisingicoccus sp. TaxID=1918627 RepID=UPI003AB66194
MNIADKYIQYVKTKTEAEPEKSWDKILLGFKANCLRTRFLPKKNIARGYQKLEDMMMNMVADSLSHKKSYIWGNIFAPCELIHSFGLNALSIECLACYVSGYRLEDFFIDFAQSLGIAPTLCSYHKTFIGAVESGVVPPASYAVTTSLSCDGNLNTFRFLQKKNHVPFTLLDVPYTDDDASVDYLAAQLETMVRDMEEQLGRKFRPEKLKESLRIENETRCELLRFYELAQHHYYPGEIIHQLYMMMGTHLLMGTQKFLDLIRFMNEEIQTFPEFTGKRILWIHLIPYYQESLKYYFNSSEKYQLLGGDIIFDFTDTPDPEDPFRSLARKLIKNVYNGSYSHKAQAIGSLTDKLHPDAVIHFCHWGCKQASGGSLLLKEAMKERNIPMLILDGDGIDHRNSHDGQIKTRLEAFLEMIEEEKK